jgi:K+-sensing histidine kinase KdpD
MGTSGIRCFLWLVIGFVSGFGASLLYVFLLGSSPEDHEQSARPRLPFVLVVTRAGCSLVALIAAVGLCYELKLDKTAASLVLVVVALSIAKFAGSAYGTAASVIAVGFLAFLFLPPIGSIRVADSGDRLALFLFLMTAAIGSQLVGRKGASRG